jgi:hypothetical protein
MAMSRHAPDRSWVEFEGISDGPPVLAWTMFLLTVVMAAGTIALLLH